MQELHLTLANASSAMLLMQLLATMFIHSKYFFHPEKSSRVLHNNVIMEVCTNYPRIGSYCE